VCLTGCSRDVMVKIDQICHKNSVKFFTGDVFGYHGYMFADLGEHEFVEFIPIGSFAGVGAGVESVLCREKGGMRRPECCGGGLFCAPSHPPTPLSRQRVGFCQLKEALDVDWSGEKAKAALKRTAPDYFLLQ
ncbi:SAE1 enzyme, partial [Ibidorhyncha struthersii]|nr:SAE1 enzyme [Ibidorhyncha struthersii]